MYKNFQNRPYQSSYKRRQYQNRKFQKNPPAEHGLIGSILSGIGNILIAPFRKGGISQSEKKIIIDRWYGIREKISKTDEASIKQAVIEADKLMDYCMKVAGFEGEKFADRLRNTKTRFPKKIYSNIWQAHILRNEIVHNIDSKVNGFEAKQAVANFQIGIKYLKGM